MLHSHDFLCCTSNRFRYLFKKEKQQFGMIRLYFAMLSIRKKSSFLRKEKRKTEIFFLNKRTSDRKKREENSSNV